ALEQHHQLIGLPERKRPQEHRVDDGEDRGVGADAERQREDGHGGETRAREQHADGVAKIAHRLDYGSRRTVMGSTAAARRAGNQAAAAAAASIMIAPPMSTRRFDGAAPTSSPRTSRAPASANAIPAIAPIAASLN